MSHGFGCSRFRRSHEPILQGHDVVSKSANPLAEPAGFVLLCSTALSSPSGFRLIFEERTCGYLTLPIILDPISIMVCTVPLQIVIFRGLGGI